MRSPLQEKVQISTKVKVEGGEGWATFESARQPQGQVSQGNLNCMPPGMDITRQDESEQNNMPFSVAGSSGVSADVSAEAFDKGFSRKQMKSTDDQYDDEHVDLFYGDAGGFSERNNYLDRI